MKFISPIPIVWNEIYKNLQQYWINELDQKMSPPPKPLILTGWIFSSDIDKRERWKSTIKWANENNCEHLIPKLGEVYAPDIDYATRHIQPLEILRQFPGTHFNVVIGSSMGALNAYIISDNIGRPTLLFNPPLVKYEPIEFEAKYVKGLASKQILLGGQDDIVDPRETLKFLKQHLTEFELDLKLDPRLGHRIPVDIFETEIASFFAKICY